jgi:hypothetical protein
MMLEGLRSTTSEPKRGFAEDPIGQSKRLLDPSVSNTKILPQEGRLKGEPPQNRRGVVVGQGSRNRTHYNLSSYGVSRLGTRDVGSWRYAAPCDLSWNHTTPPPYKWDRPAAADGRRRVVGGPTLYEGVEAGRWDRLTNPKGTQSSVSPLTRTMSPVQKLEHGRVACSLMGDGDWWPSRHTRGVELESEVIGDHPETDSSPFLTPPSSPGGRCVCL